jgi:hypothetical protein
VCVCVCVREREREREIHTCMATGTLVRLVEHLRWQAGVRLPDRDHAAKGMCC